MAMTTTELLEDIRSQAELLAETGKVRVSLGGIISGCPVAYVTFTGRARGGPCAVSDKLCRESAKRWWGVQQFTVSEGEPVKGIEPMTERREMGTKPCTTCKHDVQEGCSRDCTWHFEHWEPGTGHNDTLAASAVSGDAELTIGHLTVQKPTVPKELVDTLWNVRPKQPAHPVELYPEQMVWKPCAESDADLAERVTGRLRESMTGALAAKPDLSRVEVTADGKTLHASVTVPVQITGAFVDGHWDCRCRLEPSEAKPPCPQCDDAWTLLRDPCPKCGMTRRPEPVQRPKLTDADEQMPAMLGRIRRRYIDEPLDTRIAAAQSEAAAEREPEPPTPDEGATWEAWATPGWEGP